MKKNFLYIFFLTCLLIIIFFLSLINLIRAYEMTTSNVTITGVAIPISGKGGEGEYFYAVFTMPSQWPKETTLFLRTYINNFQMRDPNNISIRICVNDTLPLITRTSQGQYSIFYNFTNNSLDMINCWVELKIFWNNREIVLLKDFIFNFKDQLEQPQQIIISYTNSSAIALKSIEGLTRTDLERAILYARILEECNKTKYIKDCILDNDSFFKLIDILKNQNVSIDNLELSKWLNQYNLKNIETVMLFEKDIVEYRLVRGAIFYLFEPREKRSFFLPLILILIVGIIILITYLILRKKLIALKKYVFTRILSED